MHLAFKGIIRRVGTSYGMIVPMEVIRKAKLKEGDEVTASVLKKEPKSLQDFFGIAKGASKFKRDHTDHEF